MGDGQKTHRADVVVGSSRPAMETDEGPDAGLEVSEDGVPLVRGLKQSVVNILKQCIDISG
jgi:hypothetical protein